MSKINKTELLAPAGDLTKAMFALDYGADAVFVGGKSYSLRSRASNFDFNDIKEIVDYAHKKNKKVYLVTNILCHNVQTKNFDVFIDNIKDINIDGFICADPFIITELNKKYPNAEIHLSTQQSVSNSLAAEFYHKYLNAKRIVLSREVSYDELKLITQNINKNIEIEVFIHGAVCISYSGRCMMSNNFSLRDANIGGCAQSCRWIYDLSDNKNIYKNFTMSAKDMYQINNIKELLDLNISCFKIEGRMKSLHYISTVVNAYKNAINEYYNDHSIKYDVWSNELLKAANRCVNDAWFSGNPGVDYMLYHDKQKVVNQNFCFVVNKALNDGWYEVQTKNHLAKKDSIEIISPSLNTPIIVNIIDMKNLDGNHIEVCSNPMEIIYIKFDINNKLEKNTIGRIISKTQD